MDPIEKNNIIEVQCYSGYKADERPVSFVLNGNKVMADEIIDRWYSPGCEFFRVLADDGNRYLIKNHFNGVWTLENIPRKPSND